jgi:hypothetical protein
MISNADNTYKVTIGNTKGNSYSGAAFVKYGYGQVEPNHLSAQRTAQIYAQLPANKEIEMLENGQFVKYDYAKKEVNFEGAGEWMLVYNEVKVYLDRDTDADFAMKKSNYVGRVYNAYGEDLPEGTVMVPRVFKTNVGDIMTTNLVKETALELGDELPPNAEGILAKNGDKAAMKWQVVKKYTLPDHQKAVKIMRIA